MTRIKQLGTSLMPKHREKTFNWFPGHMFKGLKDIYAKLSTTDCVIEVHDARIPLTGRNIEFKDYISGVKPSILVLNKKDLADLSNWNSMEQRLKQNGDKNIILTDLSGDPYTTKQRGYDMIGQKVVDIIEESDRNNRLTSAHYRVMILGIPNVGKSTLINRLRQHYLGIKGEPAQIGPSAGVTTNVMQNIKICTRPPIYLIDTPGILHPTYSKTKEQTLKLALCSSVNDQAVNVEELAGYLLKYLHNSQNYTYMVEFEMNQPAKCLEELVAYGAVKYQLFSDPSKTYPNVEEVCWKFVKLFRKGMLGRATLD